MEVYGNAANGGNSMPDISKLPELAGLFVVTIDELLGGKSELLESAINEKTTDYLQYNTITADEFKEIAPILKPHQADTIFENVKPPFELSENSNYKDLDDIAPFVDKNIINNIARKMISEGKSAGKASGMLRCLPIEKSLVN